MNDTYNTAKIIFLVRGSARQIVVRLLREKLIATHTGEFNTCLLKKLNCEYPIEKAQWVEKRNILLQLRVNDHKYATSNCFGSNYASGIGIQSNSERKAVALRIN
jgi:hypothetical protein